MPCRPLACAALLAASSVSAQQLYEVPHGVLTRWYSFENPAGKPGAAGRTQEGRKGAASRSIAAGETVVLADVAGPGVVRRIWLTVPGQVETLRGWVVRMYWDGQDWPSVEAPLQDFFGLPFARQAPFESVFFSSPEGRSFNCVVPMPFRRQARITLANESPKPAPLFYDVDVTVGDALPEDLAYFHARYRRENPTSPKRDFEVLPRVNGRGRYLGANVGVRATQHRRPAWFGEGELKVYLDGDREWPTLVGTGTEDLVGSAWGLGRFAHLYQGAPLTDEKDGVWGFYRYHVPDPVYFKEAIRVTLQQIAGASVERPAPAARGGPAGARPRPPALRSLGVRAPGRRGALGELRDAAGRLRDRVLVPDAALAALAGARAVRRPRQRPREVASCARCSTTRGSSPRWTTSTRACPAAGC